MAESKQQQQLKEITEKLEQGVKELFTSEKYMEYLRVMSQFHNYSFSNPKQPLWQATERGRRNLNETS